MRLPIRIDRDRPGVKRAIAALSFAMSVSAVAALGTGATLGLFSRFGSTQSNSYASGTVTLSTPVTFNCSVSDMLPGASPSPCTLQLSYSGSVSAWMGLDVLIETQAGSASLAGIGTPNNLYKPSDSAHDLQVAVASTVPTVTYTVPTTSTSCPGSPPAGSTCYELDNELVSTTPFTNATAAVHFSVTVSLPSGTTTGYRGGAAQIYVTAHAAQSSHNPATACAAGATCSAVHWS